MHRSIRSGSVVRRIVLAVAAAAVLVGVLVYVFAGGRRGPVHGPQGQGLPPVGDQPGVQLGGPGQQQVARNVDISFQDRDDPTRTQARMIARQMAPKGSRGYIATEPSIWIYQSAGQTIHVMAQQGDLAMPARNQPPERGTLTGDVLIRLYAKGQDTSPQAIDPKDPISTPMATFRTPSLDFNVELGTLSTHQAVAGRVGEVAFEVQGLDVRGNQVTGQIERIESFGGGWATYTPPATDAAAGSPSPASPGRGQQAAAEAPDQSPAPSSDRAAGARVGQGTVGGSAGEMPTQGSQGVEAFYALRLEGNVRIVRGSTTTTADVLEAWVRLVDGRLPEGAVAPLPAIAGARPTGPQESGVEALGTTGVMLSAVLASLAEQDGPLSGGGGQATPEQGIPEQASSGDDQAGQAAGLAAGQGAPGAITLWWEGPLVARPLPERPGELARDDVALRLSAPQQGLVRLEDQQRQASGHAASIEYYPTTQRAVLLGPSQASVFVTAPGVGEARGIRVEIDLLAQSAVFVGPGQLTALGKDQQGRIAWAERADLRFVQLPSGEQALAAGQGQASGSRQAGDAGAAGSLVLQSARFVGKVLGQAQDAQLAGQVVDATFYEVSAGRPLLRRLVMQREPNEPASARSDRTGSLQADRIELDFELDQAGGASLPRMLRAQGAVRGRSDRADFQADRIEASLSAAMQDGRLRTDVQQAQLQGRADLRAVDGRGVRVRAQGHRVRIWPQSQRVELEALDGQQAHAERGQTRLSGAQIRLDALAGRAEVFGPGELEHRPQGQSALAGRTLTLAWDHFMLFDDAQGTAEADGNARVHLTDGRLQADRLAAGNIQVAFTGPASDPASNQADPQLDPTQGVRDVQWVLAQAEPVPGAMVVVESLRFDPQRPGVEPVAPETVQASGQDRAGGQPLRPLQSAVVIMVPQARLDGPTGVVQAEGQGRAIILERPKATPTQDQATTQEALSRLDELARSGAGEALIDWQGAMTFDRPAQRLVLERGVRLSHRPDPASAQLDLDCERLEVVLEGLERADGSPALARAVAEGAVYAATDQRELVARSLDYDARSGIVIATGDPMAPVVVFDRRSAQPASAASVRWNLRTGAFSIIRPLPAGGPLPASFGTP